MPCNATHHIEDILGLGAPFDKLLCKFNRSFSNHCPRGPVPPVPHTALHVCIKPQLSNFLLSFLPASGHRLVRRAPAGRATVHGHFSHGEDSGRDRPKGWGRYISLLLYTPLMIDLTRHFSTAVTGSREFLRYKKDAGFLCTLRFSLGAVTKQSC